MLDMLVSLWRACLPACLSGSCTALMIAVLLVAPANTSPAAASPVAVSPVRASSVTAPPVSTKGFDTTAVADAPGTASRMVAPTVAASRLPDTQVTASAVVAARAARADNDNDGDSDGDGEDGVTDPFLGRLLDEINQRRDAVGTQHLTYIPASANAALDGFLAQTMPFMAWPRPCQHHLVGGAFSWEYVLATGFGGEARGEVLACPGPEPYWTPGRAAAQWWDSPSHFRVLYADPDANALACSANGVRSGIVIGSTQRRKGRMVVMEPTATADAASAVLCVTFRD